MPSNIGVGKSFLKKYKFLVEVDGFDGDSAWTKCSELSSEFATVEQWEGGSIIAQKDAGRLTFTDVTLERGATRDRKMYDWHNEVGDAATSVGDVDPQYKRNVDVVQQDRDGKEVHRWRLFNAWPKKFVAGDWDNTADENIMNSMTLAYERYQLVSGTAKV